MDLCCIKLMVGVVCVENSDISQALSKLTEPAAVPIHKLSVSSMVHSARKRIRRNRRAEESPINNDVLNSILLVRACCVFTQASLRGGEDDGGTQYCSALLFRVAFSHTAASQY